MGMFWFWSVAAMLAVYATLDGFDIGAGIIYLLVGYEDADRRAVLRTIGPIWDGNEVWLIGIGGILFTAFPTVYASSFSGFYLPLMIVLWLLIMRGISLEFRNKIESPVWSPFWDVLFAGASALLAGFYGAAIGNIVRGVPLDKSGYFFLPLWTNFRVGTDVGILDWFTILVGLATFLAMAEHGALWVAMKTEGDLEVRCRRLASLIWWFVLLFTALVPIASPFVQPLLLHRIVGHPWGYVFPACAIAGLFGMRHFNHPASGGKAFGFSCLYVLGIATSTAFGVCPYLLPSNIDPGTGLNIYNGAAPPNAQRLAVFWFVPAIILAATYMVVAYRTFSGKARVEEVTY
jgi:cytochrome bd ubiquinol oxidase subunit II